jgi:hypothetical protein
LSGFLAATVSGSFRRSMAAVQEDVRALSDLGVLVLSPADPRIVDKFGDFVFVASDRIRHIKSVQGRHLASIAASDFLWLVATDGYVGQSAAMEIGYAVAREVPIFASEVPLDLTLRQWVTTVHGPDEAVGIVQARHRDPARLDASTAEGAALLMPDEAIQASHDDLVVAQGWLSARAGETSPEAALAALDRVHRRTALP